MLLLMRPMRVVSIGIVPSGEAAILLPRIVPPAVTGADIGVGAAGS